MPAVAVSVVIPCYNQAPCIGTAIESALTNVPEPCEVIVVDDGSTDGSHDVIARYEDVRRISQSNAGVCRARNAGLAAAGGEFVLFLDGDDWLLADGVAVSLALLHEHPECMIAVGHFREVTTDGTPLPTPPPDNPPEDAYMELLRRTRFGIGALSSVLFRRSVFDHVAPFASGVDAAADYEMYLRIAHRFPICTHATPVTAYRRHASSMSSRPELMLTAVMKVMRSQRPFLGERDGLRAAYHEGCSHWLEYYGVRTLHALRADVRSGRARMAARRMTSLVRVLPQYIETRTALRRGRRV